MEIDNDFQPERQSSESDRPHPESLATQLQELSEPQGQPPYAESASISLRADADTQLSNNPTGISDQCILTPLPSAEADDLSMSSYIFSNYDTQDMGIGMSEAALNYTDFLKDLLFPPTLGQDSLVNIEEHQWNQPAGSSIWDQYQGGISGVDDLSPSYILSWSNILGDGKDLERGHPETIHERTRNQPFLEDATAIAGAQAFQQSGWNWAPSPEDHGSADQGNLSLPQGWEMPNDILGLDPPVWNKCLGSKGRDRILNILLSYCEKRHFIRAVSMFPTGPVLEVLLHMFLHSQASNILPWIHVPTFDPNTVRDELLAAVVASGACFAPVDTVQKLGHAMPEILRMAAADVVRFP